MALQITYDRYTRDDETRDPQGNQTHRSTEEVNAKHVHQYLEARSFFEAGGWQEEQVKRPSGIIVVTTREPDGTTHTRLFTPVQGTKRDKPWRP